MMAKHHSKPWRLYRNDPCPCDSGKKYKRCCLLLERRKLYRAYLEFRRLLKRPIERELANAEYKRGPRIQTHRARVQ